MTPGYRSGLHHSQTIVETGNQIREVRKILASHSRRKPFDLFLPYRALQRWNGFPGYRRLVDDRRDVSFVAHDFEGRAGRRRGAFQDVSEFLFNSVPDVIAIGTDGCREGDLVGEDVEALSAMNRSHGDNTRLQRGEDAGPDGLKRQNELG